VAEQQERSRRFAAEVAAAEAQRRPTPARELWDSLLLLGLTVSSLGVYVGLAFAAARLFSAR
jgi:hypothetical protein